ncbi:MAG: nitroreductase family protein [Chloroflexota bacterium]|nr:nitroreductase family protein [Chloroflexota bacterium]
MDVLEAITTRRSVRKYSSRQVEDEKLEQILDAARLAPSWANRQCWRFVVVRDPQNISQLARPRGLVTQINRWLKDVPVIVVLCADPGRSGTRHNQPYYMLDAGIAGEHLVLAATALGLGTCWIGAFDEAAVKEILDIPAGIRVVTLIAVGYPAEEPALYERVVHVAAGSVRRLPLSKIAHGERWGNALAAPDRAREPG